MAARISWNPVCPLCRGVYQQRAYMGDETGPVDPKTHPVAYRAMVCGGNTCGITFYLRNVREWRAECRYDGGPVSGATVKARPLGIWGPGWDRPK